MFINCRHCNALVATDPATDAPPERCPRCAGVLRVAPAAAAVSDDAATPSPGDRGNPDAAAVDPASPHAGEADVPAAEEALGKHAPVEQHDDPDGAWRRAADLVAALASRADARGDDDRSRREPAIAGHDAGDGAHDPDAPPAIMPDPSGEQATAPAADADAADPARAAEAPGEDHAAMPAADGADGGDSEPPPSPPPTSPAGAITPVARPAKPAPSFAATRHAVPAPAHRRRWLAPVAIAVLSGLLLLQVLLADRARLAEDARWRPLLAGLCGALGCSLPPWREPGAIRLVARDVRAHPTRPGVLRATATLRNDARWPQAWPRVVLTLSDVDGRAIGVRDFAPHEYLGDMPTENTLSSGQSAMIRIDVVEPAANVVAFSFDFR